MVSAMPLLALQTHIFRRIFVRTIWVSGRDLSQFRGSDHQTRRQHAAAASSNDVLETSRRRLVNPIPYDRNAYVVKICRNLRLIHPTMYAHFAGLFGADYLPDGTLKEFLPDGCRQQTFIGDSTTEGKFLPFESSPEDGFKPTVQIHPDQVSLMTTKQMSAEARGYYAETTADYIKRVLDNSLDLFVINNKSELMSLVDRVASLDDGSSAVGDDEEIEKRCLDLFRGWVGKTKYGLSYLFFLTRGFGSRSAGRWGDGFLTEVVVRSSDLIDEMSTEETVSLLLTLYLRKRVWTLEETSSHLDPTFLQKSLCEKVYRKGTTDTELCAIFLGLRHIRGFTAYVEDFRDALYIKLEEIGRRLSDVSYKPLDSDTMQFTNLAVSQICVMLHQGNFFVRDPSKHIIQSQQSFRDALIAYDQEQGFVLSVSAALKIASFGTSRGGLHDAIVTENFLERLHLGNQFRSLSLKDMCSFLKMLTMIRDLPNESVRTMMHKVVAAVANEISSIGDRPANVDPLTVVEVRLIIQSWLHLSAFDIFDETAIAKVFEAVNHLPDELFVPLHDDKTQEDENLRLGRQLADVCFKALFPLSHAAWQLNAAILVDEGDGVPWEFEPESLRTFSHLLSSLDRTLAIYRSDTCPRMAPEKLKRLIGLNQLMVPVVVRQSALPVQPLRRRQRLIAGVFHALLFFMKGRENMVEIVHILPHFREPDVVVGHFAGNPLFLPNDFLAMENHDIKPAPEFGSWLVFSVDGPSAHDANFSTGQTVTCEPGRNKQLLKLGYEIYVLSAAEHKEILAGRGANWAEKVMANLLTGLPQAAPNERRGAPWKLDTGECDRLY